jgi:hypothetical protein
MKNDKPQFTLHQSPEGFIVCSDEEIKYKETWYNPITGDVNVNWYEKGIPKEWSKTLKVIVQRDQIDFSSLSPEIQKEIGWFDVEKLALNYAKQYTSSIIDQCFYSYKAGFQKAQEILSDRTFSKSDMFVFAKYHEQYKENANVEDNFHTWELKLIHEHKAWKVELEMEKYEDGHVDDFSQPHSISYRPKLTDGKIKLLKLL